MESDQARHSVTIITHQSVCYFGVPTAPLSEHLITTEKQQEDEKEKEIDELIEFAYDLDYEQYMEDYEVRQALAIIKDRVNEIKQDEDWKQKMADEWNAAGDDK